MIGSWLTQQVDGHFKYNSNFEKSLQNQVGQGNQHFLRREGHVLWPYQLEWVKNSHDVNRLRPP
jgi:hypothetical protein